MTCPALWDVGLCGTSVSVILSAGRFIPPPYQLRESLAAAWSWDSSLSQHKKGSERVVCGDSSLVWSVELHVCLRLQSLWWLLWYFECNRQSLWWLLWYLECNRQTWSCFAVMEPAAWSNMITQCPFKLFSRVHKCPLIALWNGLYLDLFRLVWILMWGQLKSN